MVRFLLNNQAHRQFFEELFQVNHIPQADKDIIENLVVDGHKIYFAILCKWWAMSSLEIYCLSLDENSISRVDMVPRLDISDWNSLRVTRRVDEPGFSERVAEARRQLDNMDRRFKQQVTLHEEVFDVIRVVVKALGDNTTKDQLQKSLTYYKASDIKVDIKDVVTRAIRFKDNSFDKWISMHQFGLD